MESRGVLTVAFGQPKFIAMAKSLARSLILHDPALPRAVVTDSADRELASLFTQRILLRPALGAGVRQKMYLDLYSPFDRTLFLDCDSLVVQTMNPLWRAFQHVPFGVCGNRTLRGGDRDEYLDVDFALHHFSLASLPKFNGGLYYFDRTPEAAAVFIEARRLLRRAAELGFQNHRGVPCDEPLYAVAMAKHGLTGTDMGLGGMATTSSTPITVDVPRGLCTFIREGRTFAPEVLHFAGCTDGLVYLRECQKLKALARGRQSLSLPHELLLQTTAATVWMKRRWSASLQRDPVKPLNPLLPVQLPGNKGDVGHKHLA